MKSFKLVILTMIILTINAFALSQECEVATEQATKIHWKYVNGEATITESYNAMNKMKKVCGDK